MSVCLEGAKRNFGKKWLIVAVVRNVPKAFDTLWVKGLQSPSDQMHHSFNGLGLEWFSVA